MTEQRTPMVQDSAPWIILWILGIGVGGFSVCWLGGSLGAGVETGHWSTPQVSVHCALQMLGHGPPAQWPGATQAAVWAGIIVVLVLALALAGVIVWQIRRRSGPKGLARASDLKMLHGKQAVNRAVSLRPSLKGTDVRPDDTGPLVGDLHPHGPELHISYEESALCIMAPRSAKTTAIAVPVVLRAPGAVMLTSNKSDAYAVTLAARMKVGHCWTLDPQGVVFAEQEMWWNMLAEARTLEGARRLASHFIAALATDTTKDFWSTAAGNTLTALFHAAAISKNGSVSDVLGWLANSTDRSPADILRDHHMDALGDQLLGTIRGAVETREGIFETARQAISCLLDPQVLAWVTPQDGLPEYKPAEFVHTRGTLYLLSKDGGGGAAGMIAAAADATMRAAVVAAERTGGRLDAPLTVVLDEAANVCKIADLPDAYSHFGSRGVLCFTILQSYRQGVRVWGEAGMDALWSAATVKILGSGLDDADFVEKLSRLVGDHKVEEMSFSHSPGNRQVSISRQRERIIPVEELRALPKGQALLLVTGVRAAVVKLRPWYQEPNAADLEKARVAEVAAITRRALKRATA